MQLRWLVIASAVIGVIATDPALARPRKAKPVCVDRPYEFSIDRLFFGPKPRPNYCSPPVYSYGRYVGQDPDRNIRAYMLRDPASGYSGEAAR
jgi:hypothetical protein